MDEKIGKNYKFYEFIKYYVERFHEDNIEANTSFLDKDFCAVIDGQQRLTSLYIGLSGSYKVKKPSKHWKEEHNTDMIERKLYLEITKELPINKDNDKVYNFRFLSDDELVEDKKNNPSNHWFLVADIITKILKQDDVYTYLMRNGLRTIHEDNVEYFEYPKECLLNLYNIVNTHEAINAYMVSEQEIDKVLEIFIRTNSGGTLTVDVYGKEKQVYKISELVKEADAMGHGGGDSRMVASLYDVLEGNTEIQTSIEKSVESHLMAFAAEESRITGQVVKVHK